MSTAQVASALRVSVTTVKRWVDDGVLPACKTVGGHRKILAADVVRLARTGNFPAGTVDALLAPPVPADSGVLDSAAERLFRASVDANAPAARAVILGSYQGGMSIAALADAVIAPALRRVGTEWEDGGIDVRHEHRGTQCCIAALLELKQLIEKSSRGDRPTAVGGAPEGDFYVIPTLLAELVLLDQGWRAINLGPNTPLAEFRKGLTEWRPTLLWLSVSYLSDRERFVAEYHELYGQASRAEVAVAVGGNGLTPSVRAALSYTMFGDGMSHFADFAAILCPTPQRPKRGRPALREPEGPPEPNSTSP